MISEWRSIRPVEINQNDITMGNDVARDAHCEITMGNDVARDIHCDITMNNDMGMCTYHGVTMHNMPRTCECRDLKEISGELVGWKEPTNPKGECDPSPNQQARSLHKHCPWLYLIPFILFRLI